MRLKKKTGLSKLALSGDSVLLSGEYKGQGMGGKKKKTARGGGGREFDGKKIHFV